MRERSVVRTNSIIMEKDMFARARKNYLQYFRFWFLAILAGLILLLFVFLLQVGRSGPKRGNLEAPRRRVYDYAQVLDESEEVRLEKYIAKREAKYQIDLVLVTICEDIMSQQNAWEEGMREYADDFYDTNRYGFQKVHGDGALLLDNWYEKQEGCWLSTCGSVYERFGTYEIDAVLRQVNRKIDRSPYQAYQAYIDGVCRQMSGNIAGLLVIPHFIIVLLPLGVTVLYVLFYLRQGKAVDSTKPTTYMVEGRTKENINRDVFLRKEISHRVINNNSGVQRGGGGGGHISQGGVTHGGGGRRR